MSFTIMQIRSESGDDYGPILIESKPSEKELEKYLRKYFPNDFERDDGPGIFGSYLYVSYIENVEVQKI